MTGLGFGGRFRDALISPTDTVQMGHWADDLLDGLKAHLRIESDGRDDELRQTLRLSQGHLELLAGRSFGEIRHLNMRWKPNGLPFVDIPDLLVASYTDQEGGWAIPDSLNPSVAMVMQVGTFERQGGSAGPRADAIRQAGHLVAYCATHGLFQEAVGRWLLEQRDAGSTEDLVSALIDPAIHCVVPIAGGEADGWWIQISRRIRLMTRDTPEDHRLVEVLAPVDHGAAVLVATEPMIIVARLNEHPVRWALPIRVWIVEDAPRSNAWRLPGFSSAIRSQGLPILTVDDETSPEEGAAQALLAAYWHGYLDGEEAAIPPALAAAFPKEIGWVQRGTNAPDRAAAATLLFERLLRPGFDPRRSAQSIRHYIRRHAATIVRAQHGELSPGRWVELDIRERYYYRLLAKYGTKDLAGRSEVDDATVALIRQHLKRRSDRAKAIELLRLRGFREAAARKAVQRHPRDWLKTARPRGRRPSA
jgi:hypothetical protein